MKKSINVVLASVLAFSMFSVTAFADDPTLHVEYPESGEVDVTLSYNSLRDDSYSPDNPEPTPITEVVYPEEHYVSPSPAPEADKNEDITVSPIMSNVSVSYSNSENNNFKYFNFYLPNDNPDDRDHPWVEWEGNGKPTEDGGTWYFTMPDQDVFVEAVFASPTPMPSPEAIPQQNPAPSQPTSEAIPQSNPAPSQPAPAPSQPTPVEEPQSAVAGTAVAVKVAYTSMTSALPAGTVSFSGGATIGTNINDLNGLPKNSADKFSATVLNLEAKDLTNQNGLAAYYAAIEGKEADILATYGIYASKNLSAEDNGKLTTLTWKNMNITAQKLDKNTRIKAVCYNLIDGTYTIEGEIDEFGNIILKNFIIRPAKTNITVFVCK